jgi:hypothetical protein
VHDDDINNVTTDSGASKASSVADQIKEFGGTDFLDAGLRAAQRGWSIFPCNGKKEPLTRHGCKDATTDEQQIKSWAQQYPGGLWGYALPKEIVVVDLDTKHGRSGITEFEKLQGCKPEKFVAPRVATASGGNHIYCDAVGQDFKNSRSDIAPGVDTRTLGGYVIIPSGPQSGYRWESDPDTSLPPIPRWADVALRRNSNFESIVNSRPYQGLSLFGNTMLKSACDAIVTAPGGKQEKTLNDRSFQIGRYVGGGLLERDPTIAELIKAGLQMVDYDPNWEWTEKGIEKKVMRAVDAGMLKPLDDGEEAERVQNEVRELLKDPQYIADLLEQAAPEPKQEKQQSKQEQEQPKSSASPQPKPRSLPIVLDAGYDIELPPPRAWLLGNIFCRKFLSSLFGDGGVGKTALRYAQYLSLATGRSLTGEHVFQRCRVLIISFEDDLDELRRRILAVRIHFKVTLRGSEGVALLLVRQSQRRQADDLGQVWKSSPR